MEGSTAWISFSTSSAPRWAHQVILPTRSTVEPWVRAVPPTSSTRSSPAERSMAKRGRRKVAAASRRRAFLPVPGAPKMPMQPNPRRQRSPRWAAIISCTCPGM